MRTKKNLLICYSYANEPRPLDPVSSTLSIRHLGFAYFSSSKEIIFSACKSVRVGAHAWERVRVFFRLIARLSFVRFLIVPRFVYSQVVRLYPLTFGKKLLQPSCFSMMEMSSLVTGTTRLGHPFFFFTSNNLPSQRIFCVQHKMACNPKNIRLGPLSKLGIQQLAITFVVWCSSETQRRKFMIGDEVSTNYLGCLV